MKPETSKPARNAKAKSKAKVKPTGGGIGRAYWRFAYFNLGPHIGRVYKFCSSIEPQIRRGGMRLTYQAYVAGMVLTTIIASIVGLVAGVLVVSLIPFPLATKIFLPVGLFLAAG